MKRKGIPQIALQQENTELRKRLAEAESTLAAIQRGEVDAVVVSTPQGERVFSLTGAETTYRLLIEAINEGAAILSGEGRIQYCNASFTRLLHSPPEQILGRSVLDFVSATSAATVSDALRKALDSPQRVEALLLTSNQTRVETLFSLSPYQSSLDRTREISLITTDLTEQKQLLADVRAQREDKIRLRASEGRIRAILESLPIGILIADQEGRIIDANSVALSIWGMSDRLALGDYDDFQYLVPGTDQKVRRGEAPLVRALRKGESARNEMFEIIGLDGSRKTILNNSCPVLGPRGESLGAVSVIQDVTERMKAEKLREEALAARDEMIDIVTHDLKNPLAAMRMVSELICRLASKKKESQFLKYGTQIGHTATRMIRLVSDLLDISRIESGRFTLELGIRLPHEILAESLEELKILANQKEVSIIENLEAADEPIFCDSRRISQVFSNLIGNAIKFCDEKSGRVEISNHVESDSVVFTIQDNGPGIPAEYLPHIFDRFWQAKNTHQLGSGLGLTITKGIIEAHLGRIWVESSPGKGSTFHFTLPRPGSQIESQLRRAVKAA